LISVGSVVQIYSGPPAFALIGRQATEARSSERMARRPVEQPASLASGENVHVPARDVGDSQRSIIEIA
jgi:hypothetical protein